MKHFAYTTVYENHSEYRAPESPARQYVPVRVYAAAIGWLTLFSFTDVSHAQNLPPVGHAEADVSEPLVGQPVRFSAARSFDPDEGPSTLSYVWNFDDGGMGRGVNITHEFDAAGAYRVRAIVSDSEASTEVSLTVYVLAPVAARPTQSSFIALSGTHVFVADAIGQSVISLARDPLRVAWSQRIADPRSLALSPGGGELWVACGDGNLRSLSTEDGAVARSLEVSRSLEGIAILPTRRGAVLSSPGQGLVHVLGPDWTVLHEVSVSGDPRALAVDGTGNRAYAASFLSRFPATHGLVHSIDVETGESQAIQLPLDASPDSTSSGGGVPNLLGSLAISPSGATLWVGGLKSNTGRGQLVDGRELTPENRVRGLLAPIALPSQEDVSDRRIDTNDAGQVSAMAFSPRGRYVWVAHPGIGAVSVYDLAAINLFEGREPGSTVPFVARVEVGPTPDALALDGDRLYVRLRESQDLVVLDIRDATEPTVVSQASLGADPRPVDVSAGALMFHSSRAPVFSRGGYIACAACHPSGGIDGRTWDFTQAGEGLRNTIDLRGRGGLAHGPLHWSGNFDEVQDFENDIITAFGGEGLAQDGDGPHAPLGARPNGMRGEALDALAAYVSSLDVVPRSPFRSNNGELTEAGERGRQLFFDEEVGCAVCHAPPRFTDSSFDFDLHDVGTIRPSSGSRLGEPLTGLDTPTLLGVWDSAPYLHDGRAPDLRAVLITHNPDNRHGQTTQLSPDEIDDLVAYLMQLDARDAGAPERSSLGCASAPRRGSLMPALLLAVALLAATKRGAKRAGPGSCRCRRRRSSKGRGPSPDPPSDRARRGRGGFRSGASDPY